MQKCQTFQAVNSLGRGFLSPGQSLDPLRQLNYPEFFNLPEQNKEMKLRNSEAAALLEVEVDNMAGDASCSPGSPMQ